MQETQPEAERWNAGYLKALIEYLSTCSMKQALAEYNALLSKPEGDAWLVASLGRVDLFYLLATWLRRPDICHSWLYARCREVEASPDGNLDLWAREHYKSTIITFGLTIQDILRDPEVTCGILSHTRPIAKGFLRQIKTEFEVNDDLKFLYKDVLWGKPKQEAPKWSEDEGIVVKRRGNPKESTVEAWGLVDGQPTSKHFKLLDYDDIVVKESVSTPDMIQKTTAALELSYSLGVEGGIRRWVGTRYHFNDTYRTLIERGTAKPRIYPATANGSPSGEPVLMSKKSIADKRRDMGIYTFGCQMMLNPKGDESQGFKREWLRHWKPNAGHGMNKYLLVDPANSKKVANDPDYTSMWVIGLGPDENYYTLYMIRDRLSLSQRTALVFKLHRTWRPLDTRYEEYGLQADIEHIKSEQDRLNYRFEITPVGGKTRKEDRIKRLVPICEQGRFYLPQSFHVTTTDGETKDMVHEFTENEYMAFPVAMHDDMLDGLARIAEPDLQLSWPARESMSTPGEAFKPLDPGMGY